MLFNSLDFFVFLPLVLIGYYLLKPNYRWIFLLFASYFFYAGWKVNYLGLILLSTVIDYFAAILMGKVQNRFKRRLLLTMSLISNFGLLILFKYFHFLIGGSHWFKELANQNDHVLWLQFIFEFGIPVGISFYTFQTVSYTVDVYRKRVIPEKNFGKFALYVTYFPQLVAGPIERFEHLHGQLFKKYVPRWEDFRSGLQMMLAGFFLKMVVADNIGGIVSPIYDTPENFTLFSKLSAIILFGIQIYTDFNGYSMIALGVSKFFGINLMDNFKSPYSSYSIKEFWSRWHISLSTWFRDYVYIPIGGSQAKKRIWLFAIFLTFFLSGLWHGAAVNFIYWGLLHGVFYIIEQSFFPIAKNRILPIWEKIFRWILTMSIVGFGWLLFRVDKMRKVKLFFQEIATSRDKIDLNWQILIPILFFVIYEIFVRKSRFDNFISSKSTIVRWSVYSILLVMTLWFSSTGDLPFIYFQF